MMAANKASPSLQVLLILLPLLYFFPNLSHADSVAVYWGQTTNEGTLEEACKSGNYAFVNIAFLSQFGGGQAPMPNLAGHCDPSSNGCTGLAAQIKTCQTMGIKVLLSIGGGSGKYGLSSADDASSVADYIYNNFLSGSSASRPFGDAVLDGVDFDIEAGNGMWWETLAERLSSKGSNVILSAAPQCPLPDAHLNTALKAGVFDYVWVQFYNNAACQYSGGDIRPIVNSWNDWASNLQGIKAKLFLGLPASAGAASGGYIPTDVLTQQVLPAIKTNPKYGGVMLWDRFNDINNKEGIYSNAINVKPSKMEVSDAPNKIKLNIYMYMFIAVFICIL